LSDDVTAVHVALDAAEAARVRQRWEQWGEGVRLVILESRYRQLVEPLLGYLEEVAARRQPYELITVVVPQFVPRSWWHNLLHNQTVVWLRWALLFRPGIIVTDVPFHVD
nr:permease [Candidatus Tectomicrobia bacterium]